VVWCGAVRCGALVDSRITNETLVPVAKESLDPKRESCLVLSKINLEYAIIIMSDNANELIRTIKHTASGAPIQVSYYGATLISYRNDTQREFVFVSKQALLDGTAPVRGGIPLVFPIFGPPTVPGSTMPQHGFARRNIWSILDDYDTPESAGITFQLDLKDASAGRGEGNIWTASEKNKDYDCTLFLKIDLNGSHMTSTFTIRNTGSVEFPFQCLLHTYYKIEGNASMNSDQCFVKGLEGYLCDDKVTKEQVYACSAEPIGITGEVDRVYTPPNGKDIAHTTIGVGDNTTINMEASGQVDGVSVPVSCVVWNPYIEKAAGLADFGNNEYHDMICVEPGILGTGVILLPGKEGHLKQVVRV
jgi:glucose-6-phosphate 1-epimerase